MANSVYYMTDSSIRYDELRRVFPDSADLSGEVYQNLDHYRSLADRNSLTLLFIRAHGIKGEIGGFEYADLFNRMDQIMGKKVLIGIGCYSGGLVRMAKARPRAGDYAVISSTTADRKGVNWSEDEIFEGLCEWIRQDEKLSDMPSRIYTQAGFTQTPIAHLPFDVVL
jgi:hypothetical protein